MSSEIPHGAIELAGAERNFIIERIPKSTDRTAENLLVTGLLDLALEHHLAMLELLGKGELVGSALALARPLVEACYRLIWTATFNDEDVTQDALWHGTMKFKSFSKTIDEVEAFYAKTGLPGFFASMKHNLSKLNGLVHGGLEQIHARFNDAYDLDATYYLEEQVTVLRVATYFLVIASTAALQVITGDQNSPAALEIATRIPGITNIV